MPNIVYVLTNPAMPGFVKIGMTNKPDVQHRMAELYSTGVPLPFECVIAREIEGIEATATEQALHTAFGPERTTPSREFFELDPDRVVALLRVMPGRDVTPQDADQSAEIEPDDREASLRFKRRQSQTNEQEFIESLSANSIIVYERVLALGKQNGMRIIWGLKGFSLNAVSSGGLIAVCYGYPPSAFDQRLYTDFDMVLRKSNVPPDAVEALKRSARDTGLFEQAGRGNNFMCRTDRSWDESQLATLTGWLSSFVERIREYETVNPVGVGEDSC
jgi:hypothetical protein